jgi:hypothetical protein
VTGKNLSYLGSQVVSFYQNQYLLNAPSYLLLQQLPSSGSTGEVLSSSEFDKFLAERAAAAAAKDQGKKPEDK